MLFLLFRQVTALHSPALVK